MTDSDRGEYAFQEKFLAEFRAEAGDLLVSVENLLLELEKTPQDQELVSQIFRALHTIKGSGAMVGQNVIASFAHHVETLFDLIRNRELEVSKEVIDLGLDAVSRIRELLDAPGENEGADAGRTEQLLSRLQKLVPGKPDATAAERKSLPTSGHNGVLEGGGLTYRLRFEPLRDIFARAINPLPLLEELRQLGRCTIIAHVDAIPAIENFDPESCYTYWDIILTTDRGTETIRDIFILFEDEVRLTIGVVSPDEQPLSERDQSRLAVLLQDNPTLSFEEVREKLRTWIGAAGQIEFVRGQTAPGREQRRIRDRRTADSTTIRVTSERLDRLINLVGELVTAQARLSRTAEFASDSELTHVSEEIERLTADLQDNAMSLRMVPIGSLFGSLKVLVRDLSGELHKDITLITEGAKTELDKTMIEKLHDPFVHLIRNSIDHGIEAPEVREAAGKERTGTIHLSAEHSGGEVVIRIRDDGGGLDTDAIRTRATEQGLIPEESDLPDQDIFSLILDAGFSTASTVTSVSGRGVGMDIVKKCVDGLRGLIDIDSQKGEGVTITIRLPLTLAIIEGLTVRVGEEQFVLPLSLIEECVELRHDADRSGSGRRLLSVRGELIPFFSLREHFALGGDVPEISHVIVATVRGRRVGIAVDHVVGEHRTVIKSLGNLYRNLYEVSGATIMADGSVALILDVPKLTERAERDEMAILAGS